MLYKTKISRIDREENDSSEYLSPLAKIYLYICMKVKKVYITTGLNIQKPLPLIETVFDIPEKINALVAVMCSFVIFLLFNPIIKLFIQNHTYLLISGLIFYPAYFFFKNLIENEIRKIQRDSEQVLYFIDMNLQILENSLPKNQDPLLHFLKMAPYYPFFENNIKTMFLKISNQIAFGISPKAAILHVPPIFSPISSYFKNYCSQSALGFHSDRFFESTTMSGIKEENKRLDTSLSLFFFSGTIIPIGITYLTVLRVITLEELIAVNVIFIILVYYQFLRLKTNSIKLFGIGSSFSSLDLNELDRFIDFGLLYSKHLVHYTPKIALIKTLENLKLKLNQNSYISALPCYYQIKISQLFPSATILPIAQLFDSVMDINSQNAETIIINALEILKNHNNLMREKLDAIRAEQFKARLFNYLIPMILSILTGISLVFSSLIQPYQDLLINSNSGTPNNFAFFSIIPLISIENTGMMFLILHLLFQSFDIFFSILLFGKLVELNRPIAAALFGLMVYLAIIAIFIIILF